MFIADAESIGVNEKFIVSFPNKHDNKIYLMGIHTEWLQFYKQPPHFIVAIEKKTEHFRFFLKEGYLAK
jgi:hypothetical protein